MKEEKAPEGAAFTLDEVKKHCKEIGSPIDAEVFYGYYANKHRKLKNWKTAVRIWEKSVLLR